MRIVLDLCAIARSPKYKKLVFSREIKKRPKSKLVNSETKRCRNNKKEGIYVLSGLLIILD